MATTKINRKLNKLNNFVIFYSNSIIPPYQSCHSPEKNSITNPFCLAPPCIGNDRCSQSKSYSLRKLFIPRKSILRHFPLLSQNK